MLETNRNRFPFLEAMYRIVRNIKKKPAMKPKPKFTLRTAKRRVFAGKDFQTTCKRKEHDYVVSKRGKVVSKQRQATNKKNPWIIACGKAKKALGATGMMLFVAGTPLCRKANQIHTRDKSLRGRAKLRRK